MINWDESAPVDSVDIVGYILYMDDGYNGKFMPVYNGINKPNIFYYRISGITTGLPYRFKLVALNVNG